MIFHGAFACFEADTASTGRQSDTIRALRPEDKSVKARDVPTIEARKESAGIDAVPAKPGASSEPMDVKDAI